MERLNEIVEQLKDQHNGGAPLEAQLTVAFPLIVEALEIIATAVQGEKR